MRFSLALPARAGVHRSRSVFAKMSFDCALLRSGRKVSTNSACPEGFFEKSAFPGMNQLPDLILDNVEYYLFPNNNPGISMGVFLL
jgi:hypothetical protein